MPHLKRLRERPGATPRQKVISEMMSGVERTRIDTERNLLDVLDKVNELSGERVDPTHMFALSQVYEGLLLKMGEKGNDGGQFFTPREVIRAMVRVIDPRVGETVYDPGCGTGGFLAQAYEHMAGPGNAKIQSADQLDTLKRRTFYGREKDNAIYPIGLANLVLHDIDEPHIWHGNTLTGQETYGGLFTDAPALFDVILMNPPFGGKEGKEAQTRFAYKTRATQVLFLQHVIDGLKPGGQEEPAHDRPLRGVLPPSARPRGQRAELDGGAEDHRGKGLRPQGRQPAREARRGPPNSGRVARPHRGQGAGGCRGRRHPATAQRPGRMIGWPCGVLRAASSHASRRACSSSARTIRLSATSFSSVASQ